MCDCLYFFSNFYQPIQYFWINLENNLQNIYGPNHNYVIHVLSVIYLVLMEFVTQTANPHPLTVIELVAHTFAVLIINT